MVDLLDEIETLFISLLLTARQMGSAIGAVFNRHTLLIFEVSGLAFSFASDGLYALCHLAS